MDIRSLTQFLEVAKNKSYTKAAKKLFLAQPTLTKTVKGLENELGVKLFDHIGQTIILTDYGRQLMMLSEPLVNEFNQIPRLVKDIGENVSGTVSVGTTPMLGGLYLVNYIPAFNSAFPRIELQLRESNSFSIMHDVYQNTIELGLCMNSEKLQNSTDFDVHLLFSKQVIALIHESNPLSKKEKLSISDLQHEKINSYALGHAINHEINRRCQNAGFLPQINFSSNVTLFLVRLTESGDGITIMPKAFLSVNPSRNTVAVPFDPVFPWECCLITRKGRYLSEAARTFISFILEKFDNME
ncbi:MAG: LysR family transcriptional regulator [Lachnospiraceae bacterium]|nr:LysR family transcriptional regulator [Lachnospiraceae bacterium]